MLGDLPDGPVVSAEERITEHGLAVSAAKLLPPNTLLVAMYGSIGKLGITTEACATNQAIAFCKPHAGFNLNYLFYLLMGERYRLPGTEEVGAATDEVGALMQQANHALVGAKAEARRSTALRRAVLGSAFGGQLVSQNPADEPASTLLERIAAERATSSAAPKRGRLPRRAITAESGNA